MNREETVRGLISRQQLYKISAVGVAKYRIAVVQNIGKKYTISESEILVSEILDVSPSDCA